MPKNLELEQTDPVAPPVPDPLATHERVLPKIALDFTSPAAPVVVAQTPLVSDASVTGLIVSDTANDVKRSAFESFALLHGVSSTLHPPTSGDHVNLHPLRASKTVSATDRASTVQANPKGPPPPPTGHLTHLNSLRYDDDEPSEPTHALGPTALIQDPDADVSGPVSPISEVSSARPVYRRKWTMAATVAILAILYFCLPIRQDYGAGEKAVAVAFTPADAEELLTGAGIEIDPTLQATLRGLALITTLPTDSREQVRAAIDQVIEMAKPMMTHRNGYPLPKSTDLMVLAMLSPDDVPTIDRILRNFAKGTLPKNTVPVQVNRSDVTGTLSVDRLAAPCHAYKLSLKLSDFTTVTRNVACFSNTFSPRKSPNGP